MYDLGLYVLHGLLLLSEKCHGSDRDGLSMRPQTGISLAENENLAKFLTWLTAITCSMYLYVYLRFEPIRVTPSRI
jgi:hypothetical protein